MSEAVRFIAGFHNVAVMREPVQKRRRHLRITEYCVFRPIVTDHFGSVTADFGVVTGHFGIVTEAIQ